MTEEIDDILERIEQKFEVVFPTDSNQELLHEITVHLKKPIKAKYLKVLIRMFEAPVGDSLFYCFFNDNKVSFKASIRTGEGPLLSPPKESIEEEIKYIKFTRTGNGSFHYIADIISKEVNS